MAFCGLFPNGKGRDREMQDQDVGPGLVNPVSMPVPMLTAPTSLFGGPAMADFNLPFLLSIDNTASGDNGRASAVFADLLDEMTTQPNLLGNAPNLVLLPGGTSAAAAGTDTYDIGSNGGFVKNEAGSEGLPVPGVVPIPPELQTGTSNQGGEASGTGRSGTPSTTTHSDTSKPRPARGGGSRRSSKTGIKSEEAVMRRAAVQKRYREKKEANMQHLAAEADRQAALLAALESEHAALLSKQSALEKLVLCRDEQLQVLARVRGMCRGRSSLSGGPSALTGTGCWGPDCAAPATTPLDNPDTLMHIQAMTMPEMRQVWMGFVSRAADLLSQIAAPSLSHDIRQGTAQAQLEQLVGQVGGTMKRVIQLNCPIIYGLMQINLETGAPSYPSDDHMKRVLSLVKLTPEQHQEAVSMFKLYLSLMEKVLEERALLKQSLAAAASHSLDGSAGHGSSSQNGAGHSDAGLPAHLLPPGPCCADEMSCAEQLYLNLHKERSTRCLLCCFFFGKLLTPVQLAKAAVASHPFFLDPLGLCRQLEQTPLAVPPAPLTV